MTKLGGSSGIYNDVECVDILTQFYLTNYVVCTIFKCSAYICQILFILWLLPLWVVGEHILCVQINNIG